MLKKRPANKFFDDNFFNEEDIKRYIDGIDEVTKKANCPANPQEAGKKTRRRKRKKRRKRTKKKRRRRTKKKRRRRR